MKKIGIIIVLFVLAFSIRTSFILFNDREIEKDEIEHDRLAVGIVNSAQYVDSEGRPTSYRPPGYPAFLALIYSAAGRSLLAVRLIQALIGSLSVCLFYILADKIFGPPTAVFTGIFTSFYMIFVRCANFLYTEILFTFLLLLTIYLCINHEKLTLLRCCFLGFICGILTLIKTIAFFVPMILIAYIAFKLDEKGRRLKKAQKYAFAIIACFLCVLLPWTIRNYKVHKNFVLVSTNGGLNFYQGVCWSGKGVFNPGEKGKEIWAKANNTESETERSRIFMKEAINIYLSKPLFALKMLPVRFLFFWSIIDWEILGSQIINYHFVFIFPFACIGIFLALRNLVSKKEIWLLLFFIFYFTSFTFLFPGVPRYRIPIDGFIIMFGGFAVCKIIENPEKRAVSVSLIGAYWFAAYMAYQYSLTAKYFTRGLMQEIGLW